MDIRRINDLSSPSKRLALSQLLREIADDETRDRVSVGDLLMALGNRALGALLFIFAFPNILPTPPGTSAVLGAPLIFLSAQLTFGNRPWLPKFITLRSMSREDFLALISRIGPWLAKAEKLLRPRASRLAIPPMQNVVGLVTFFLSMILVLPIPLGNVLPAVAISIMALGILEKDGLWVTAGLIIAVISGIIVSGVVFTIIKAAIFLVQQIL